MSDLVSFLPLSEDLDDDLVFRRFNPIEFAAQFPTGAAYIPGGTIQDKLRIVEEAYRSHWRQRRCIRAGTFGVAHGQISIALPPFGMAERSGDGTGIDCLAQSAGSQQTPNS